MSVTQRPPAEEEVESTRLRLTFLTMLVVLLFVLLFGRLWYLQLMAGERYLELAQGNAVRTVSLVAPRGEIYDAEGELLVANEYVNVVSVQPGEIEEERRPGVYADLADLLGTTVAELEQEIATSTVSPVRPKPVADDVPEDVILYIWENQSTRYPGVYAERLPQRQYPDGQLAAHVLGYTGEISEAQLASEQYEGYRAGDQIGWDGLERTYESALRGTEGQRALEVDARGNVVRQVAETLPREGSELVLSIDADAQRATERALRDGIELAQRTPDTEESRSGGTFEAPAGAVVVMRPTGEVVAMASYPSFEPEAFVGGVSSDYYAALLDPDRHRPLLNRAVQSAYPPGSVFKVVSAAAALEHGFATDDTTLPCPSAWSWNGAVWRNWAGRHMGQMDLERALEQSCDTVFYELARRMYQKESREDAEIEYMGAEAKAWGLGRPTGIDLPSEEDGVVPGREWRRAYWEQTRERSCRQAEVAEDPGARRLFEELCSEDGARWRGGDAVNMSIGQGDTQTTPLQIATAYAAIANGGTLYSPRVVAEIHRPDGSVEPVEPEPVGELPISDGDLAVLRRGLERVAAPGGTAGSVFGDFPVPTAGKTGTAEAKPRQPYSWYASYAPADDPEYVVVSVIEQGGGGSRVSAPVARQVYEELFADIEESPIQAGAVTE